MSEEELVRRIAALELQLDGLVKPEQGLQLTMADKDGDGDYDPLTAAAWEDTTLSGTGTINWNTVFGVPVNAKAVLLYIAVKDATVNTTLTLKAKSTTTAVSGTARITVTNTYSERHPTIPIAADGTSYYAFSAAMDNAYVRVVGWYI